MPGALDASEAKVREQAALRRLTALKGLRDLVAEAEARAAAAARLEHYLFLSGAAIGSPADDAALDAMLRAHAVEVASERSGPEVLVGDAGA
jgi:hypothetical protein